MPVSYSAPLFYESLRLTNPMPCSVDRYQLKLKSCGQDWLTLPQYFYFVAMRRAGLTMLALFSSLLANHVLAQSDDLTVSHSNRQLNVILPERITVLTVLEGVELSVELDGYDVSLFAQVEGTALSLQLQTSIAEGGHSINVLVFMPNGEIETLLEQTFDAQRLPSEMSDWKLNSTFATSYRLDQKEDADFEQLRELSGQGALAMGGSHQAERWEFTADLEALYDSMSQNHAENQEWALPAVYVSAEYQADSFTNTVGMGDIKMQREDLLFSAYQRRGVEAAIKDSNDKFQVQIFGLQSEPQTGYNDNQIMPTQHHERVSGATASVVVVDDILQLSLGYLDGETGFGGTGVYAAGVNYRDPVRYGGDSWNLAADSRYLNKSVWLHLEYAQSTFDSDGIGLGEAAATDDAAQVLLQLSSEGDFDAGYFDYWSGSVQRMRVGADYFSLGNLSLAGDMALTRLLFSGSRGGLAFNLNWSEEESNVDDNPFLPKQTLVRVGTDVNYIPGWINPESLYWQVLGTPSLSGRLYQSRHTQPQKDAATFGFDLNNRTDEAGLTLNFSRNTISWSLQYDVINRDDKSQAVTQGEFLVYTPPSDSENRLTGVFVGWFPHERLSFNTSLQWNKQRETDADNQFRSRNFTLGTYAQLLPSVLSLTMSYNYGRNTSDLKDDFYIEDDFQSQFVNAEFSWKARRAKGINPGVNVFLKGSYAKQENNAFSQITEQWSALVGAEIYWDTGARR